MDPDLGSSLTAAGALALALLGRQRRSRQPDGAAPTIGERAAGAGTSVTGKAVGLAGGIGRIGTEVVAGTLEVAGFAAGATVRAIGRVSDNVSVPSLNLAVGTAVRAGGVVLDGVAALVDGVGASLHRKSTAD